MKLLQRNLFAATGILLTGGLYSASSIAAPAETCKVPTDDEVSALFTDWNNALKSEKPADVAALYQDDAVLLPTLSPVVRVDNAGRIGYFTEFLKKKPQGEINTRKIFSGCNSAVAAGTYTFTFADKTTAQARYTFTYRWNGEKWLISSHHSSVMPEQGS